MCIIDVVAFIMTLHWQLFYLLSLQAVEAAFSRSVEHLCQSHAAQMAEVAPEMQLIRASVAFGLFVKHSCPELKSKVQEAMTSFLNSRVESWVAQKGGWVSRLPRILSLQVLVNIRGQHYVFCSIVRLGHRALWFKD